MTIENLYPLFLESSEASTDTRKISKNCMFFALKGENFNGNIFAQEAIKKGAKYAIVDEDTEFTSDKIIKVNNALETLQKLSNYHRKQLKTPIIALTGSNGKTTTKELINAVLSTQYNVIATLGNFNNHIGVPLTLLRFTKQTEIGIVEMGANHQKEIEFLCNIALPDYGLITNFGKAHLEGFGGVEGVIKGKSELYTHLKQHNKLVFINYDDNKQLVQINNYKNTKGFSLSNKDNCLTLKQQTSNNEYVSINYSDKTVNSNLVGNYNFNNIAYAITIGDHFKISTQNIIKSIESYVPDNNRSQIINKGTNKIILDAYNANPSSMKAAIDNFKTMISESKVMILGDMFELGDEAKSEHQSTLEYAEENIIGNAFFVGENFYNCSANKNTSLKFSSYQSLANYLQDNSITKSTILIKGSRGMALERLLDIL